MTIDSLDNDVYGDILSPEQMRALDFLGVQWRGRNVREIYHDVRSLAIERIAMNHQHPSTKSLLDYVFEKFPENLPDEAETDDTDRLSRYDPVSGTQIVLIAAEKKKKKKKRKWWMIATAVVVVAAVAITVAVCTANPGAGAAAATATAGAMQNANSNHRKNSHDNKSSVPPPPPILNTPDIGNPLTTSPAPHQDPFSKDFSYKPWENPKPPSTPTVASPDPSFWSQVRDTAKRIIVKDLVHPGVEAYGWVQSQLAQTGKTLGLNSQPLEEKMAEVQADVQQKHATVDRFFGTEYAAAHDPQLQEFKRKTGLDPANLFIPFGPSLAGRVALFESSGIELKALPTIQQGLSFENVPLALREARALERAGILETTTQNVVLYQHPEGLFKIRLNGTWEIEGKNIKRFDFGKIAKNSDKMDHLFKEQHAFHKLNRPREDVVSKITQAVVEADQAGNIPQGQPFNMRFPIDGYEIEVHGNIVDGELRYGTFFIPEE